MLRFVLVAATVCAAACGSKSPSSPTDTGSAVPSLFSGAVAVKGASFYSFTLTGNATVNVMLASLTTASGTPLSTPVTLGVGVPKGTGCGVTSSLSAVPALKSQISLTLGAGIYCVNIADAGSLADTTNFAIRILVTTGTVAATGSAGVDTFATNLTVGGVVTRAFTASESGTLGVTLTSAAGQTIGFGVGLWDGIQCGPTTFGPATDGAAISLPVDAGVYCVKLSDLGTLKATIPFTVTINHP
jgi:hypothetical protein